MSELDPIDAALQAARELAEAELDQRGDNDAQYTPRAADVLHAVTVAQATRKFRGGEPRRVRLKKAIAAEIERGALGDYFARRDARTIRFDGTIDLDALVAVVEGTP